ncbi:PHP domain-containing protein [Rathayibacter sp. VKM Ac-2856]|uniref:PHP domain-containing protein n=1 Tax=unclassified Rathayibacter TaxID=2609250 RepID=UPI001567431E|nr:MULTISPECIES: PHP domain-containing protein [unclassified Rathayibacter]NQX06385.1 PHP domain-containing protein [Rathayibacter sp. VKM Ac-2858]NQX21552.1 PHP domain-containing protein [Rathayibacter sp. VKM Ac-2856]
MHVPGGGYDLHTHSLVSDGTEPPEVLVAAAAEAGLDGVALTDHDTTRGWEAAIAAADEAGIDLLPGMELSSRVGWASVHVLAYLPDPADPGLVAETERIRSERSHRAQAIVAAIAADYDLTWDDVLAQTSPGTTIGRPHIADALVARGLATDRSAAFAGILDWRGGYFQPHYAPDPVEAVRLVRAAGGVPVIAHPATSTRGIAIESMLPDLVDAGLFGLEVEHRENTAAGKRRLRELAARYSLVTTGSSDYHGTGKPNRLGENTTARATVDAIRASARPR